MIYLDTNALVKLIVREKESKDLLTFINARAEEERAVSAIARTELLRVIRRKRCNDQGKPKWSDNDFARVQQAADGILNDTTQLVLDEDVLDQAAALEMFNIKALDAIHLASALTLGPALTFFVTYDRNLRKHAEANGLTVIGPT